MTNQILTKAIEKAIAGGWMRYANEPMFNLAEWIMDHNTVNDIIYDHDFAAALWGSKKTKTSSDFTPIASTGYLPIWQQHLMLMVIADDPIKYLGEHLD